MDEGEELALPASLQRLWGITPAPPRGPRAALHVEQVVRAAIDLADRDGLDAVSMSRVATELGVTTMALYRHVDSKDELLELMLDCAGGEPPAIAEDDGWRAGLERWAWALLGAYRRRPWMTEILITGPPIGPHSVAWMEAGMGVMRVTVLDPAEKLGAIVVLTGHVRAEASLSHQLAVARARSGQDDIEAEQLYVRRLAALVDPEHFPEITALVSSDTWDAALTDAAEDAAGGFDFGLACILDGLAALVARRANGR